MSTASPTALTIDKRSNISAKELYHEYILPSKPVVLTDAALKWSGMGKLTPEYFKNTYGHLSKEVKGVRYTIAAFVDLMMHSTPENPAPYPFNLNVKAYFPELLEEIKPEILFSKSDRVNHPLLPKFMLKGTEVYELFFGGKGSFFPYLHTDALALHTQITQLYGTKEFFLYSPDQTECMYPTPANPRISAVNIFNPDYDKFPLFKNAQLSKVTVYEGESILFPTGWWHGTMIHGPSISLGRVQLNAANWDEFVHDNYEGWKKYKPAIALPALAYAKVLGKVMNLQEKFI